MYRLPFCPIETQPIEKAKPSNIFPWASLVLPRLRYLTEYYILPAILVYEQLSSWDCSLFSYNISVSEILSQATYRTWWKHIDPIYPTFSLFPLLLLVSIALTVINTFSGSFINLHVGRINPGTFGAAHTTCCSGLSEALMPLHRSTSDASSASKSSSIVFGSTKSTYQVSQFSVSDMVSGALFWSLSTGWRSILLIRQTFITWVCPPGRSLAV